MNRFVKCKIDVIYLFCFILFTYTATGQLCLPKSKSTNGKQKSFVCIPNVFFFIAIEKISNYKCTCY